MYELILIDSLRIEITRTYLKLDLPRDVNVEQVHFAVYRD